MKEWIIEQHDFETERCIDYDLHPKYDKRAFSHCDGWHQVHTYDRMRSQQDQMDEYKIPHRPLELEEALTHMVRIRESSHLGVIEHWRMRLRNLRTNEIICEEIMQR